MHTTPQTRDSDEHEQDLERVSKGNFRMLTEIERTVPEAQKDADYRHLPHLITLSIADLRLAMCCHCHHGPRSAFLPRSACTLFTGIADRFCQLRYTATQFTPHSPLKLYTCCCSWQGSVLASCLLHIKLLIDCTSSRLLDLSILNRCPSSVQGVRRRPPCGGPRHLSR